VSDLSSIRRGLVGVTHTTTCENHSNECPQLGEERRFVKLLRLLEVLVWMLVMLVILLRMP
jgi:hypothetical protein